MNRDIAVVVSNDNSDVTFFETANAIKKAGFRKVFIQWYDEPWIPSQEEQLAYLKKIGLDVIFAHLGYQGINNIWKDDESGDILVERYIKNITECEKNGVPMVIIHLSSKNTAPPYGKTGLLRLKKIVDYAEKLNIKVAFENNKIKGYPDFAIQNLTNKNVGLCFDVGHWHAHFKDELDFYKFKDRIFAVHLHDNNGKEDEHLMPFDGTVNWPYAMQMIKTSNYQGPITLEICYGGKYAEMTIEEFYKFGYTVGEKLRSLCDDW